MIQGEYRIFNKNNAEKFNIRIANLDDAEKIIFVLKANLVQVNNINELTKEKKAEIENKGFLRKEVPLQFYKKLIEDKNKEIYIASDNDDIIGFASIYKNQNNILKIRDTSIILNIKVKKDESILIDDDLYFIYLDQISVIPDYQHKGIATSILNKIIQNNKDPIVSFVVNLPLKNNASDLWHTYNNFKLIGTAEGNYKNVDFLWNIYMIKK
ncbi:MAG: GNAT family N-acetyltransferase [Candidatus Lokiarchaeota archaeon]|nr:GNAT family N-acetyltransferase [Candidatus Lokiarchaeota archaeon]